jgi:DNA-binding CsgD family transcriptional regulator
MARTRQAVLLDAIDACHACKDIDAWPAVALAQLALLIDYDLAAFNDFDPDAGRYVALFSPAIVPPTGWEEVWPRVGGQNPAYRRLLEQGDVGPLRLSDFLDQRRLRATELYRLLYRQMGVRYQLATALEAPSPQITAIVLNRETRDFTNAELELLRLIRPHLRRAYDNARAFAGIERDRTRLAAAARAANVRVVSLSPDGLVVDATGPAVSLLERHLSEPREARLPEPLAGWARGHIERREPASSSFATQIGVLTAALVPGPDEALLLLDERYVRGPDRLPLTSRERHVLDTIAGGITNAAAARKLHVGESTIAKHLEHIYRKLGVQNRGAALALYERSEPRIPA